LGQGRSICNSLPVAMFLEVWVVVKRKLECSIVGKGEYITTELPPTYGDDINSVADTTKDTTW